jgi:bifunctional pyridoxal-dependent enzyme with beta-cystathionase and maltose regulon repressor activities
LSLFDVGLADIKGRKGRKWTRYGPDVIPMWIADSDFHLPPQVTEAIVEALAEEDVGYGDDSEARRMMANKIVQRNNIQAEPEKVLITQGVLPAMWLACRYACEPGDEVIVTDPMYYPFFEAVESVGARPVYWRLNHDEGYQFDTNRLNELISPRTKLVFVCNPHNPTGRAMTRGELSGLADIVVDHGLTVMADELWEDVLYDGRQHISLASLSPEVSERTMTSFGFSKMFSVAGLQVGYLTSTNGEMMAKVRRFGNRVLRGTSTLSIAAAKVMLSEKVKQYAQDALTHLQGMRDLTFQLLNEVEDVTCNRVESTYLAFPRVDKPTPGGTTMADYLLKEARVAVEDGSRYGPSSRSHIRINFGTGGAVINEAVARIMTALDRL